MLSLNKYLKTSKLLVVVCLFLFKNILVSQNLISNPSFERVDTPVFWNSGSFINSSVFPPKRNVTYWDWHNSPDYFSTDPNFVRVPTNDIGVSYPKHGNAYGGLICFFKAGETKEYIYQNLNTPLIQDSLYCISFFVSRADRTPQAIHSLGAYFSVLPPPTSNVYINVIPQVVNQNGYITDTIGWTEVKGCFTAQGGEQYVTIGNFNSNANTDTLFVGSTNPHPGAIGYAYYYIDSVTLWQNNFPTFVKEDKKGEVVSVYPNPANTILNIALTNLYAKETLSIKLTDLIGREILTSAYKEQLDISALEKGIYFLSVEQGSKRLGVKKIIKE
ncbi:MAG: T9SS type A sorting domain-containing protein [Bacteroidia bacterium]